MKHPCVEIVFRVELNNYTVRVWYKTDGSIVGGLPETAALDAAEKLSEWMQKELADYNAPQVVKALEDVADIAAFEVTTSRGIGIVVYRDWP